MNHRPKYDPTLIFDVGVCNGDDSAYYLHKGFRVVGIEANPILIPILRERFRREIVDGRYELQAVGIAEDEGEARFWVNDDKPEWSSFDRSIASRNGSRHHFVTVRTSSLRSIIERFGVPFYCKIDIEGNDDLCLTSLTACLRPRFLSIELLDGGWQIAGLRELGYTKFKIISQRTLRQPSTIMTSLKSRLPYLAKRVVAAAESRLKRYAPDRQWRHARGSSGPFGDETHGEWRSAAEVRDDWQRTLTLSGDLGEWHDIHATS